MVGLPDLTLMNSIKVVNIFPSPITQIIGTNVACSLLHLQAEHQLAQYRDLNYDEDGNPKTAGQPKGESRAAAADILSEVRARTLDPIKRMTTSLPTYYGLKSSDRDALVQTATTVLSEYKGSGLLAKTVRAPYKDISNIVLSAIAPITAYRMFFEGREFYEITGFGGHMWATDTYSVNTFRRPDRIWDAEAYAAYQPSIPPIEINLTEVQSVVYMSEPTSDRSLLTCRIQVNTPDGNLKFEDTNLTISGVNSFVSNTNLKQMVIRSMYE